MSHFNPLRRVGGRGSLRLPAGLRIAVGHVLHGKVLLIGAVVAHLGTGDDLRRPQRRVVGHAEGDHRHVFVERLAPHRLRQGLRDLPGPLRLNLGIGEFLGGVLGVDPRPAHAPAGCSCQPHLDAELRGLG